MKNAFLAIHKKESYPFTPSSLRILGNPSRRVDDHPSCVWILTLTASMGQRAMSAKNSAEALAARYSDVLHRYAFSWKIQSEIYRWAVFLLQPIYVWTSALSPNKIYRVFLISIWGGCLFDPKQFIRFICLPFIKGI